MIIEEVRLENNLSLSQTKEKNNSHSNTTTDTLFIREEL